jgi:hypothetical protein
MAKQNPKLDAQVENLKKRGVSLPRNHARAQLSAATMHQMASTPGAMKQAFSGVGERQVAQTVADVERNNALIRSMGAGRRLKVAGSHSGGGDAFSAIPRFYDPMEFWDLNGLPWNTADEGHRHKLHKWLRLYYATHYLVPILIDIFTRFPLVGMELECKDKKVKSFYEDLFLRN